MVIRQNSMKVVNVFSVFSSRVIGCVEMIVYIGRCICLLWFSVVWNCGVLWMFRCIYSLIVISSELVRNGMCQFYCRKLVLFIVCLSSRNMLVDSRKFSGVFSCGNMLYQVCLLGGVFLVVSSIVLFYFLFSLRFWLNWYSVSSVGVYRLMLVCVGSILISIVDMFIVSSVVISVVLCLMWLLQWLNIVELIGCVMNVIVKVVSDCSRVVLLLLLGKNRCGNISIVVVVQMQKLKNLMVVLIRLVSSIWWGELMVGVVGVDIGYMKRGSCWILLCLLFVVG